VTGEEELERAQERARQAREQFLGVAHTIQARLMPSSSVDEAWDVVREKSEVIAGGAVRAVAKRPVAASAAALGLVAVLARKPIARLFGRSGGDEADKD
jgi:hypothetical protein